MAAFKDYDEYMAIYDSFKTNPQLEIDANADQLIPEGTVQKTNNKGLISWKDPVTNRAMSFANVHARNAWLVWQEKKGVLKRRL